MSNNSTEMSEQPIAWSISYTGGLANFYCTESEADTAFDYLTKKYGAVKHRFIVPLHTGAVVAALRAEIERLNNWCDGMADRALKERTTADAWIKELHTKLAESEALLAVAVEAIKDMHKLAIRNGHLTACNIAAAAITKIEGAQKK